MIRMIIDVSISGADPFCIWLDEAEVNRSSSMKRNIGRRKRQVNRDYFCCSTMLVIIINVREIKVHIIYLILF